MVFYPVRGSPECFCLHLRNIFGYRCTALFIKDGGQVMNEF